MKLLVVTQKLDKNDSYFGFFHDWVARFAKECEHLTVITLELGFYDLPPNVNVFSLGKEKRKSRLRYLLRFYNFVWRERDKYNAVFCHMSPLYVIFGFPVWRLLGKKISLWYIHFNVDLKLRIAEKLSDIIFSSTKESFRIASRKVNFMGQAVDVSRFTPPPGIVKKDNKSGAVRLISVGRITPVKNIEILIEAVSLLKNKGLKLAVEIVGEPVLETDYKYKEKLIKLIANFGCEKEIIFAGSVPNKNMPERYWQSDISVNMCPTGGMDKVVLESMAAHLPVFISNKAFWDYFGPYAEDLIFKERNADDLAKKLELFINGNKKDVIVKFLSEQVQKRSDLDTLIKRIAEKLS